MNAPRRFRDRVDAGESLASLLQAKALAGPYVVIALPRGGLPVAVPVARRLGAALDVMAVRKIGLPRNPECAIGAVAPGVVYRDDAMLPFTGVGLDEFRRLADAAEAQRRQREQQFRSHRAATPLKGSTAVLVDDGMATGATMMAAIRAARAAGATRVVVAVPVASAEAVERVSAEADSLAVLQAPQGFNCVGEWYRSFPQVEDSEAVALFTGASA